MDEKLGNNLIDLDTKCGELKSEAELHRYWQDIVRECKSKNDDKKDKPRISRCSSIIGDKLKFARIYSDLIHSGKYTEKLINLEFSYWPAVDDMFKTRDTSLEELQIRSSKEIEEAISQLGQSHTEASISLLSSRHCQDMERLLNNWNMSIEALKDAQREDFCERLNSLWNELISNREENNSDKDNLIIRKDNKTAQQKETTLNIFKKNKSSNNDDLLELDKQLSNSFILLDDPTAHIKMEESFTINLGSQLKTAHNLRILAVDSLYLCDTQRNRSSQVRTQTAMSLYSNNLSAIVLLVDNHFNSYYGIQHEFSQLCSSLNEFHFDTFNKQIKQIQEQVMPVYAGRHNLELGDCYITRHSNLANAHVVFHLVTDDSLKNGEVNSRHPMLASLRNILRVAHMYDIKTISIPLLLVDEMDEEILTVNWCLKRAELVLKCVKGFLIEMASLSTGVEQGTIQFLVPKGISEELFTSLASLIPEVFRLANSVNLKSTT